MSETNNLPLANLKDEALRLLSTAGQQQITLRLFGGMAVHLRCPATNLPGLKRSYGDLDYITDWASLSNLEHFFKIAGYQPDRTLNTLYGDRRQLYFDEINHRQVDILVDTFEMCHTIPLGKRLKVDEFTLPLSELLLTKAQIVEMNRKDVLDMCAMLVDHASASEDGELINLPVIQALCSDDWGLFTTVTENLTMVYQMVKNAEIKLSDEISFILLTRLSEMNQALVSCPKTAGWKMRALIGKRMSWFEEVEEIRR
ncbi:MAG: hypothetical protein WCG34_03135 [Leptolinea sp.]